MGWGSYAKRLTGQVPHTMPVLKPPIPPFRRWSAPQAASMTETGTAPSLSHTTLAKAPESAAATTASTQMEPTPTLSTSTTHSSESQRLTPSSAPTTRSFKRAEASEPSEQRVLQNVAREPVIAEPNSNNPATMEAPKINLAVPSFPSTRQRASRKQKPEQEHTIESSRATPMPASTQSRPAAVSFLPTKPSREPAEDSLPIRHREEIVLSPRSEPNKARRTTSEHPPQSTLALQPRKNPTDSEPPPTPMRFESRHAERSALPAAHRPVSEPQARTAGGLHIGTIEVRIMPPAAPAPPIIKPVQARPSPAPVLSRSLTSSLGLTQGQ